MKNVVFKREEKCKGKKNIVFEEATKGLNWREKIIARMNYNICIKIYRKGMLDCFNYYNKDGTF